jgi:glycosyltransferase involved in cell wall biosynthesis
MSQPPRQLRLLQVANQPGPFYCFLRPLIFELMRRGVEVDVACNSQEAQFGKLAAAGMSMLPLGTGSWARPGTWLTIRRQLRDHLARKRYDICVVHTPAISWLTRREAARAGVPVVAYTAHGLPFFERQNWLVYQTLLAIEKHCARSTDLLLTVNSDDTREAQRRSLVKPGGLIRHIPGPGIDVGRCAAPPPPGKLDALRCEFSLSPTAHVVVYLGRLMASKGVLDLVEMLARLAQAGRDVHLLVAGGGELAEAMARRAAQRRVADRLHLLGWRDDNVPLLHLADLLVLPSTYREGLPTVLMEAAAAGKPTVAYRNRGSNDIILDGRTGYLVPAHDVAQLTDRVARLLDDAALARSLGEAGRRHVAATFSYAQGVAAQLDAYAAALEAKGLDAAVLRGPLGEPVFSLAAGPGDGS